MYVVMNYILAWKYLAWDTLADERLTSNLRVVLTLNEKMNNYYTMCITYFILLTLKRQY